MVDDGGADDGARQGTEGESQRRGDPVDDALARFPPIVVVPLLVAGLAVMGSVKWMSSQGSAVPPWLSVLWVVFAVPMFVATAWRGVRWLQRPHEPDTTLPVSEQRPDDAP